MWPSQGWLLSWLLFDHALIYFINNGHNSIYLSVLNAVLSAHSNRDAALIYLARYEQGLPYPSYPSEVFLLLRARLTCLATRHFADFLYSFLIL